MDAPNLLETALLSLGTAGVETRILESHPKPARPLDLPDAVVRLGWRGRTEDFDVTLRTGLRPASAGPLFHELASRGRVLLVSDRITGGLAELAREMKLPYLDTTGNAWIPADSFFIDIEGRRPLEHHNSAQQTPRAGFTRTELRVVLAAMTRRSLLERPIRELAAEFGVSHGAVHQTLRKLEQLGYLGSAGLRRRASLADAWTDAYLVRGGAHKSSRTLFVDPELDLAAMFADSSDVQISGELAGELLGWPIRAASAVAYAPTFTQIARQTRGSSRGPGRTLEIRTPPLAASDNGDGIAASLLVRADMFLSKDPRQIEVAQEVMSHDQNLRRLREAA